uniref:Retrotransposon gag protein n=1 Tax=Solanum tuberosum TaxID=4113 RepID=M1E0H8_SOLTU
MSVNSNYEQMDHLPLEVMRFRDNILTFKHLKGEQTHESWLRFKALLLQCPTHEIPELVLLECFYRSLISGNKELIDQLIASGLVRQLYVVITQLLDHMTEANQEVERDFHFANLLTQLDELTKKFMKFEVQGKKKDQYIPPLKRRKPKNNEDGQVEAVEAMLTLLLNKVNEQDRVLEELRGNVAMINQMITSHSMIIPLQDSQIKQLLSCLYIQSKKDLPSDTKVNLKNRV